MKRFVLLLLIIACAVGSRRPETLTGVAISHNAVDVDGVVYAVSVSLGFALWENIQYVLQFGMATALARAVTAVPGHACFGVFMGTWYGAAKRRSLFGQNGMSRFDRMIALIMPVILHGCYDYIVMAEDPSVEWLFFPFVAVLYLSSIILIRRLSRRDSYMS